MIYALFVLDGSQVLAYRIFKAGFYDNSSRTNYIVRRITLFLCKTKFYLRPDKIAVHPHIDDTAETFAHTNIYIFIRKIRTIFLFISLLIRFLWLWVLSAFVCALWFRIGLWLNNSAEFAHSYPLYIAHNKNGGNIFKKNHKKKRLVI